jgi:hypothetical protein
MSVGKRVYTHFFIDNTKLMQSKSLLIAIAAFAVTASGVHAYSGTKIFTRAGLSEDQITAFTQARELRESGNFDGARDVLLEAGINDEVLKSVHQASKAVRLEMQDALNDQDYETFVLATEGTDVANIIKTEADFTRLAEAYHLQVAGNAPEAKKILDELGIDSHHRLAGLHQGVRRHRGMQDLSSEQLEALSVARQANDKKAAAAILKEAGIKAGKRAQ